MSASGTGNNETLKDRVAAEADDVGGELCDVGRELMWGQSGQLMWAES